MGQRTKFLCGGLAGQESDFTGRALTLRRINAVRIFKVNTALSKLLELFRITGGITLSGAKLTKRLAFCVELILYRDLPYCFNFCCF
jgi:hypothetical protein